MEWEKWNLQVTSTLNFYFSSTIEFIFYGLLMNMNVEKQCKPLWFKSRSLSYFSGLSPHEYVWLYEIESFMDVRIIYCIPQGF